MGRNALIESSMTLGDHTLGTFYPSTPEHRYYDYSMMGLFVQPDQKLSIYSASQICDQAFGGPGLLPTIRSRSKEKKNRN